MIELVPTRDRGRPGAPCVAQHDEAIRQERGAGSRCGGGGDCGALGGAVRVDETDWTCCTVHRQRTRVRVYPRRADAFVDQRARGCSSSRGRLFVEGQLAKVMCWGLYKQHQVALDGLKKTALITLAEMLATAATGRASTQLDARPGCRSAEALKQRRGVAQCRCLRRASAPTTSMPNAITAKLAGSGTAAAVVIVILPASLPVGALVSA